MFFIIKSSRKVSHFKHIWSQTLKIPLSNLVVKRTIGATEATTGQRTSSDDVDSLKLNISVKVQRRIEQIVVVVLLTGIHNIYVLQTQQVEKQEHLIFINKTQFFSNYSLVYTFLRIIIIQQQKTTRYQCDKIFTFKVFDYNFEIIAHPYRVLLLKASERRQEHDFYLAY